MHDEVRGTAGTRHLDALLPLTAVAIAIAVHARALGTYFARDDITFLLRAEHHLPPPGLARILSTALAISVEHAAFGLSPVGYHVVNLALHAVNVLGVYALALRLSSDRRVAWLAAVCFGTSSIAFTPMNWVTGIVELLTAACLLGATLVAWKPGPPRAARVLAATLLLLAALLSKETALPWVAVMLVAGRLSGRRAFPARSLIPAGVLTACVLGWFLAHGTGLDTTRDGAYAMRSAPAFLAANLATYFAWSVAAWNAIPDAIAAVDADAWRLALPACVVLWLALGGLPGSRRTPIRVGATWWLGFLLPVLPLANHTYYYYLYIPWIGGSIALACLVSGLADRLGARRASLACAAVAAIHVGFQWRDVSLRSSALEDHLPIDDTIRDSQLIRHAVSGLESAALPAGSAVGFVNPVSRTSAAPARGRSLGAGMDTTRSYIPLEAALRGGETLALLAPQLRYRGFSSTIPPDWLDVDCFRYEQRGWLEYWGKAAAALRKQARVQAQAGQAMAAESTWSRVRALDLAADTSAAVTSRRRPG